MNGRGPRGQGPLTGRRTGRCRGAAPQLATPRGPGSGRDCGSGGPPGEERGQVGWPWPGVGYPLGLPREQELPALKRYAESLERTLNRLKARIRDLAEP
jgi:hypothetical protein